MSEPRDHHYAPQFYLRNFAIDHERKRITTVAKHGAMAVWRERSIDNVGYERDFYVHMERGLPVSVETDINRRIETPISQSQTWAKIAAGRADALDASDRPMLYALIRHLEVRTPHYEATVRELATMAAESDSRIEFADHERRRFVQMRENPELVKRMLNAMATTMRWSERSVRGSLLSIYRSPIPIRTSTTPSMAMPVPFHPAMDMPVPGMKPYQLVLPLNPATIACLTLGDFDGAFFNEQIDLEAARGFNRRFVGRFAKFEHVRHLVTSREDLETDMTWAPYERLQATARKIIFRRKDGAENPGAS
jgi:hypothetical protein